MTVANAITTEKSIRELANNWPLEHYEVLKVAGVCGVDPAPSPQRSSKVLYRARWHDVILARTPPGRLGNPRG